MNVPLVLEATNAVVNVATVTLLAWHIWNRRVDKRGLQEMARHAEAAHTEGIRVGRAEFARDLSLALASGRSIEDWLRDQIVATHGAPRAF